jgi:Fe-S oxidoreductase
MRLLARALLLTDVIREQLHLRGKVRLKEDSPFADTLLTSCASCRAGVRKHINKENLTNHVKGCKYANGGHK